MPRRPIDPDPFEPDADPLLSERAGQWLGEAQEHLSESALHGLAALGASELAHLLECQDCAMRASTQLARGAVVPRSAPWAGSRRWVGLAAAALLLAVGLRVGLGGSGESWPARASLLHDPAALRAGTLGELRRSELTDGRLSLLLNVECEASFLDWEIVSSVGRRARGQLALPAQPLSYREFVLEVQLAELLPEGSGELSVRASAPDGAMLGQWQLPIRP